MDDLTNEQKKVLVSLYKEVLSRQPALSFDKANYFRDSDEVMNLLSLDSSSSHIFDLCGKLKSKGYINCDFGDNLAIHISLDDKTIIYMENRFGNGIKSVIDFLSKFH